MSRHIDLGPQPLVHHAQRSPEWLDARLHRMTGSVVPKALGMWTRRWARRLDPGQHSAFLEDRASEREEVFRVMAGLDAGDAHLPPVGSFGRERIQYGVDNEGLALDLLEYEIERADGYRPDREEVGLLLHPRRPYFGCSVDALYQGGVLAEAKCGLGYAYREPKPQHLVQVRWNQAVVMAASGGRAADHAWWVGFSLRGSAVRRIEYEEARGALLMVEMDALMTEYTQDWLPAHSIDAPRWLETAVAEAWVDSLIV